MLTTSESTKISLCFVVQAAEELKKQYLDMLPLANASVDFINGLNDVQMEVGDFVRVCE